MTDAIVSFDRVSKSYDGRTLVVDGLDLALMRGEFLTLLGPSGSGKTTTLMMLAGFEDPTSGTITLDGKRIDNVPAHKRGIGMVVQQYALFPHMRVEDNVAFGLKAQKAPKGEIPGRVAEALEMTGMGAYAKRYPRELSGGQQQRVGIARAIVSDPGLLLCDEPTGDLDRTSADEVLDMLRFLNRELEKTIVMVTHDPQAALHARRTLHLDKGDFREEKRAA